MQMTICKCLSAISLLSVAAWPAHAATIVSPSLGSPVTAAGSFRANASPLPATARDCTVVMNGYVTGPDEITFTDGLSNCDTEDDNGISYALEYPIVFNMVSTTQVKADYLRIYTFAICIRSNVNFSWANSTIAISAVTIGSCNVSNFTLTISPTVTVI